MRNTIVARKLPARLCLRFLSVMTVVLGLWSLVYSQGHLQAASASPSAASAGPAGASAALAASLGVQFIAGSTSTLLIERDGRTYLVDLAGRTVQLKNPATVASAAPPAQLAPAHASTPDPPSGAEIFATNCARCHGAGGQGVSAMKTPNFTNPAVQTDLPQGRVINVIRNGKPGTAMPAWSGKLSADDIDAVAGFVKSLGQQATVKGQPAATPQASTATVYEPADDYLFSLPTGRKVDRHGLYLNFTHRFAYSPAFSGTGLGDTLLGLDDFSISSFGLRYGLTDKVWVSAYRSPSLINRPIELGVAYHFLDEHNGKPFNATVRASEDGQNNFAKNFTTNLELIVSRSIGARAQLYAVPTLSLGDRELTSKSGTLASIPPNLPGFNTFSLGAGGALDIRPSVALVAEVIPTLVNGEQIGIHRPAFAFGIQKRVLRHAFTLGFSTSPGTITSQRAGTRATFLGDPSADTPKGLFIGFDLMRQIY